MNFFRNLLRPTLGILYLIIVSSSNTVAEQQPSTRKDSTENTVNAPEHLQRVLLDSIDPKILAQLVKAINPEVTPNNTRLTLMPTARTLKTGTGYIESMMLFFWSTGFAITDKHAILGGLTLLPGAEIADQLFYFGTKSLIHQSESLRIATGILALNQKDVDKQLSTVYSVATLGNEDGAVSILAAYGFEGREIAEKPFIILGAERRLGRRTYFVGEIPMYDDEVIFPLLGIRRYSEDGRSHWGYTFPYLINYSFSFGKG